MNKKCLKTLSLVLSVSLMISGVGLGSNKVNAEAEYGLSNPKVAYYYRDTLTFGNYWQEDTNGDGKVDETDDKQPIKWQILSQDGNDVFLMSDKILDYQPYGSESWENSLIREWLNTSFYDDAFTDEEKLAIKETVVDNPDSEDEGADNPDTTDKVYLLSHKEVKNTELGFENGLIYYGQSRKALSTGYVKDKTKNKLDEYHEKYGVKFAFEYNEFYDDTGSWWLRAVSRYVTYQGFLGGSLHKYDKALRGTGLEGAYVYLGVRPVLHLDIDKASGLYDIAGNEKVYIKGVQYDTVNFGKKDDQKLVWRVLHVSENDALIMSEESVAIIDPDDYPDRTWKDNNIRKWLNTDFYYNYLSDDERAAVNTVRLHTKMAKEEVTEDNVYLQDFTDVINPSYGYAPYYYCQCVSRELRPINYDYTYWCLRNSYYHINSETGLLDTTYLSGKSLVRPVLHINLSSGIWEKGETITLGDTSGAMEQDGPSENVEIIQKKDSVIDDINPTPTPTGKPSPTTEPTSNLIPTTNPTETPAPTAEPIAQTTPTVAPSEIASPTVAPTVVVPTTSPTVKPEVVAPQSTDNKTTFGIKNKAKLKSSSKIKIKDKDKIQKITLNGKTIKIKSGKTSFTLKLKSYKKKLKKKGKWNILKVTDKNGNVVTIKFKIK